ncbi:MAG: DUF192 domain-containing protein [bacterium]
MDDFKKIIIPILGVTLFIIFVGFLFNKDKAKIPFVTKPNATNESKNTVDIKIGSNNIKAILANTEGSRKKGLGGTEKLDENGGMFFVFEKKDIIPSFWMKDMNIAVDILWINDGEIVQIDKNVQPPEAGTKDNDLAQYTPGSPVDYVLEVKAGYSDKNGIKTGDSVEIPSL